MKKLFTFSILAFAAALSGCSLIGFGIGALVDPGTTHDTVAIFTDIADYRGQIARIRYNDSSVRYAKFVRYSDEPESDYRKVYDQYISSYPSSPAAITFGEPVTAKKFYNDESLSIKTRTGTFNGYYPEGILLTDTKFRVADYDSIISAKRFSMSQLRTLFEANLIPVRGTLYFKAGEKTFSLTNRDFQNIMVMPHNAPGRWIGLGIGAAIDIAIIIMGIEIRNSYGGLGFR